MQQKRLVLLAQDPLYRRLLGEWIAEEADLNLVACSSDPAEAVGLARHHECDLVGIDVAAGQQIVSANYAPGIRFSCHRQAVLAEIRAGSRSAVVVPSAAGPKAIAIIAETGGPLSLSRLWRTWPGKVSAPILVGQHMPLSFTEELVRRLNEIGTIPCRVATHGTRPEPGVATIAPGGVHMTLSESGEIVLDRRPTGAGSHTTADQLFGSVASRFGQGALGIVLSGSGPDGLAGCAAVRAAGGVIVAESADSALVPDLGQAVSHLVSAESSAELLLSHGVQAWSRGQSDAA